MQARAHRWRPSRIDYFRVACLKFVSDGVSYTRLACWSFLLLAFVFSRSPLTSFSRLLKSKSMLLCDGSIERADLFPYLASDAGAQMKDLSLEARKYHRRQPCTNCQLFLSSRYCAQSSRFSLLHWRTLFMTLMQAHAVMRKYIQKFVRHVETARFPSVSGPPTVVQTFFKNSHL